MFPSSLRPPGASSCPHLAHNSYGDVSLLLNVTDHQATIGEIPPPLPGADDETQILVRALCPPRLASIVDKQLVVDEKIALSAQVFDADSGSDALKLGLQSDNERVVDPTLGDVNVSFASDDRLAPGGPCDESPTSAHVLLLEVGGATRWTHRYGSLCHFNTSPPPLTRTPAHV